MPDCAEIIGESIACPIDPGAFSVYLVCMDKNVSHIISGGMGAAASIAVTQLVTRESLDCPLYTAVTIFAVTISVLVYLWIDPLCRPEIATKRNLQYFVYTFLFIATNLATLVGFVMLFFHFGVLSGILWSVMSGALTLYVVWLALFRLRRPVRVRGSEIAD
jgi:hypothetical protein